MIRKQSLVLLGNCEYIRIEVNAARKGLLVIPVNSKDRDCIRWVKSVKEPAVRKIECGRFTQQLYEAWGLNDEQVYRAIGKLVAADNKVMLLFDFNENETWKSPEAGGKRV